MPIADCKIIDIPTNSDVRGNVSFFASSDELNFCIKRLYYIHGVVKDEKRGMHAHKELRSIIIAISGSFKVKIDDGADKKEFMLSNPKQGLYISNLIWRELYDFSPGAVAAIIASEVYDEGDYIRNYDDFLLITKGI